MLGGKSISKKSEKAETVQGVRLGVTYLMPSLFCKTSWLQGTWTAKGVGVQNSSNQERAQGRQSPHVHFR